jgi:tetratricopeptide (TPR) repeat protein
MEAEAASMNFGQRVGRTGAAAASGNSGKTVLSGVVLLLVTALVFLGVVHHPFIAWDDNIHTYENPFFQPVSAANLQALWRHPYQQLYIPVSYMVYALLAVWGHRAPTDASAGRPELLFDPHVFHTANLLIHGMNVLLVFVLLRRLVPRTEAALAGALLFALHPVQVESVAWISEMRGTLCGLFSLLALWQYLHYADDIAAADKRRGRFALFAATFAFALALLCKPAAVAVPIMAWLLARSAVGPSTIARDWPLILWTGLSAAVVLVTRAVQPVQPEVVAPFWARPLIAGDALAFYLQKLVVPVGLAMDYGRTPAFVLGHVWTHWTWLIPLGLGIVIWRFRRQAPWLVTAAGLFVAWLLPVLGLIPFTFQTYSTVADRYLYLALLGPALALAALLNAFPSRLARSLCVIGLALCAWRSVVQVQYWADSATLFRHALAVNPHSWTALDRLGEDQDSQGKSQEAIAFYRRALAIAPEQPFLQNNLGKTLTDIGDYPDALVLLRESTQRMPDVAQAHYNFGRALELAGQFGEAIPQFTAALRLQPNMPRGWNNLGLALQQQRQPIQAIADYRRALQIDPSFRDARYNLGGILVQQGDLNDAIDCYQQVIAEHSGDTDARFDLAVLLCQQGQMAAAVPELSAVLEAHPTDAPAHYCMGVAQATLGNGTEGLAQCREALRLDPGLSDARRVIALIIAHQHKGP